MAQFTAHNRNTALTAVALVFGMLFTGCLTQPEEEGRDRVSARVALGMNLENAASTSDARIRTLVVTLASSAGDTLVDTITENGSRLSKFPVRLEASSEKAQVIQPLYSLNPAHDWNVHVKSLDAQDSVVNLDSTRLTGLQADELRNVYVSLASRFAAYEAAFPLPAKTTDGRTLRFQRLVLAVDGTPVCEEKVQASASQATLLCDYLPSGTHTVTLSAYGMIEGKSAAQLLFQGEKTVALSPGSQKAETVVLGLTAANVLTPENVLAKGSAVEAGTTGISVRLGRVGLVVMEVVISGGISI
jgi:hypothetical protein